MKIESNGDTISPNKRTISHSDVSLTFLILYDPRDETSLRSKTEMSIHLGMVVEVDPSTDDVDEDGF